ncbi:hypothetical protein, partial [Stenotrophomonas maltophilia]|uniref:hypothetical protein n=1 Tax=Stenotrophomonas maltophilia TaxID=40324 RepID=UPI0031453A1B
NLFALGGAFSYVDFVVGVGFGAGAPRQKPPILFVILVVGGGGRYMLMGAFVVVVVGGVVRVRFFAGVPP